ncbi:MAG: biopolymer transporter ExbD [Planctomycetota bacterium]|nr:MAG: biopolymer transporter ExbD [Planctomycetota bacterium]
MTVKIHKGRSAGLLNLTPMIDVVFQLLLFFLVATKFAEDERELKIVLPHASEARPLTTKPRVLFVNVDREGRYFVDGDELNLEGLEDKLEQISANNPGQQTVEIRADRECLWEYVVAVMNLCNKAGIRDYRVTTTALEKPG